MANELQEYQSFLRWQHDSICFEVGQHPDEYTTAFSAGADALERVAAIDVAAKVKNKNSISYFCGIPVREAVAIVMAAKKQAP